MSASQAVLDLDGAAIAAGLRARQLGSRIEVRAQIGSTNEECVRLARAGEPAGTVMIADWQSAGRGRRGRRWLAPPGSAVLLSVVLRPALPAEALGRIGMAAALAAAAAVRDRTGLAPAVKYPNDVLLEGRKLAGVLCEAHLAGERVEWAVAGVGLNVRQEAVPPDLVGLATSLEEHGALPARIDLARALLERLEQRLDLAERDPRALAAEWRVPTP